MTSSNRLAAEALLAVRNAIEAYNKLRPHMSCSFLTLETAHQATEPLV